MTISPELESRLQKIAESRGITVNEVIIDILTNYADAFERGKTAAFVAPGELPKVKIPRLK